MKDYDPETLYKMLIDTFGESLVKRRIKHNDLVPWFIQDHGTLPSSYLASCRKFFKELSDKHKQQASEASK
jgi:hypothetical protein